MRSKNIVIIFLIIVILAVTGYSIGCRNVQSSKDQSPNYQFPPAIDKIDTSQNGPWNEDLYFTKSNDGTNFGKRNLFIEAAGVPSITQDSKGKLIAAFQWFPKEDTKHFDQVALVTSKDNGETWTKPQPMKIADFPSYYQRPFDPTVVALPNGKIRMYFTSATYSSVSSIFSAISNDGINYIFETGRRYSVSNKMVIDSTAGKLGDTWHMIGSFDSPEAQGSGYHATSKDGLKFVKAAYINFGKDNICIGNILVLSKTFRFYGSGFKIWWTSSKNGNQWSNPVNTNVEGGDPAIVKLPNSEYLMIYVGLPEKKPPQPPK